MQNMAKTHETINDATPPTAAAAALAAAVREHLPALSRVQVRWRTGRTGRYGARGVDVHVDGSDSADDVMAEVWRTCEQQDAGAGMALDYQAHLVLELDEGERTVGPYRWRMEDDGDEAGDALQVTTRLLRHLEGVTARQWARMDAMASAMVAQVEAAAQWHQGAVEMRRLELEHQERARAAEYEAQASERDAEMLARILARVEAHLASKAAAERRTDAPSAGPSSELATLQETLRRIVAAAGHGQAFPPGAQPCLVAALAAGSLGTWTLSMGELDDALSDYARANRDEALHLAVTLRGVDGAAEFVGQWLPETVAYLSRPSSGEPA